MGANDPCHNLMGKLNYRLGRRLASYQKEDSPSTRSRTLPLRAIQALDTNAQGTTSRNIAISNLTWVTFFFLLRPGKYCKGGTDITQHPFSLKDIQLFVVQQTYNAAMVSNAVLAQADFVSLLFTTHNNGVKGELIGHMAATGHSWGWLVRPCPINSPLTPLLWVVE